MEEYMVVWGTRIVALGFILYFSFDKLVVRMLRRMHVIPYKPFASRAEYLVAAAEMNLEDFIGRAKATPDAIKRKAPVEKPDPVVQRIDDFCQKLREQLEDKKALLVDVTTTVDSSRFGSGEIKVTEAPPPAPGFQGIHASTGLGILASVVGCNNFFGASAAQRRDEKLAKKFPLDRWFRNKISGDLAKVTGIFDGLISCSHHLFGTVFYSRPEVLEPAVPKAGEWWRWTKHELLDGLHATHLEPFCFGPDIAPRMAREVEAGNLEPVNCDKGEQKSGVA